MAYQMSVLYGKAAVATHLIVHCRKQKHGVISLRPDKKTHIAQLCTLYNAVCSCNLPHFPPHFCEICLKIQSSVPSAVLIQNLFLETLLQLFLSVPSGAAVLFWFPWWNQVMWEQLVQGTSHLPLLEDMGPALPVVGSCALPLILREIFTLRRIHRAHAVQNSFSKTEVAFSSWI